MLKIKIIISITVSGQYKQPIERTGDTQSTRLPLTSPGHARVTLSQTNGQHGRQKEKAKNPYEISIGQIVTCSQCRKTCLSPIGFISHQPAPDEDFLLSVSSFAKQSHAMNDESSIVTVVKVKYNNVTTL